MMDATKSLMAAAAVAAACAFAGAPVVVTPDSPTEVELSAAKELAGELGKCLGGRLAIVPEGEAKDGVKLFVGATKEAKRARGGGDAAARGARPYQTDEVFLKSVPGGVVLDGDPARAPIYAVDLYLEKYCGVRWWTSDAATYPKLGSAPAEGVSLSYVPQFKYRETYYLDGFDPLFKVRSKGNFSSLTRYMLSELKFVPKELGGDHRLYFFKGRRSAYHSFFEVLPPKVHFEKHPEWYSLVGGRREPKQLCLANAEMKAEYVKETLRRLREDPAVDFIQVSQNDWHGYCTCEKCRAMMDEDGGAPSGPYLRFANYVAEAVEKEFPHVRIDTFAYQFTRRAPAKTRPRRNVVVRLCDIECDFARPLADASSKVNAAFAKDLADWRRVAGGNLFIWDYLANFTNYMMPHPNIGSIAPNIRLFAESGAVGVFEQGDALCSAGSFATLRHYVASHLLWDPKEDESRLMDEFLAGYYGKAAAPALRKFIAVVEAGPRATRQAVKCNHAGCPFLGADDKLRAVQLMDEAAAAAEREGEPFASRVRRERLSIDHMLLLNYDILRGMAKRRNFRWIRPATKAEAVENWIRDVKSFGVRARRETTRPDEIGSYFAGLRKGARPAGMDGSAGAGGMDLYLLIGQSNMAGRGMLTAGNRVDADRIFKLDANGRWQVADEPIHFDKKIAGAGLAASFARAMADRDANAKIGLIPCAVGGTRIDRWVEGGDLWSNAVRRTRMALKGGRLKGILWHQGEGDADPERAPAWGAKLEGVVKSLRREFGEVPFVAGELGWYLENFRDESGQKPLWREINAQLHALEGKVRKFRVASARDLKPNRDNLHFDTASLREFGCRYAAALADMEEAKREGASAPQRTTFVQMGGVRVGFTLGLGEWCAAKNARSSGGVGSERAFAPMVSVPHGEMKSLSVTTNGNVVTAVWKGHPLCGESFTVTAKMTMRPDGGFEYTSFDYAGNESGKYVQWIVFPEVVVPRTEGTAVFCPRFAGDVQRPDWKKMKRGQIVTDSGPIFLVFNCMAALEEGGVSHFLDQRGEARMHCTKLQSTIGSAPDTLVLRSLYRQPVTDATRRAGGLPYSGVYAPYRGGWYEAAKMHRAWMEKQPWFKAAAARDFSKLREIDLWMWSRGNIAVSEPPVHWFMKETGLKVALDWYWWHNVPYDTSYPFFWPPRDGEAAFRAAVKRMKDRGAFLQVYTNGMLWDEDDPRWAEGGLESTIVRDDGRIWGVTFNPFTKQSQGHMCGEAPKFQAKMRALEKNLASTGLDGVYMDMISCAAHLACFNPRHKHAPGDVRALVEGYRRYVDEVHADNPGFLLSSEATSETYLDKFESFIMLYSSWERNGLGVMPRSEPVPAVTVIYRGAGVLYGSFATPGGIPGWDPLWGPCPDKPDAERQVAKYPDQFAVEFARGIVWGVQPMVHNFVMRDVTNPRLARDVQFIKDSAKFYHDHKDFLFDGEMLRPAKLACAAKRVEFLKTSSYGRPHESGVAVQKSLPCVFHSEWRAPDGRRAAVLVNWTREEQEYEIEFEGAKRRGTLPAMAWRLISMSPGC